MHDAAVAIVLAAIAAGSSGGRRLAARAAGASPARASEPGRRPLASAGFLAIGVTPALGLALNAPSIVRSARAQYRTFTHLAPSAPTDRFVSGSGNRYDYWRVAWREFRSEPLRGVGAGNYQPGYYRQRRTAEPIQQPHSLELQTLAELGLVGAVLLAGFLVVVGVSVSRAARRARAAPATRTLAVAASGLFAGWFAQTSVDWEHLIPGLTLIALALGRRR